MLSRAYEVLFGFAKILEKGKYAIVGPIILSFWAKEAIEKNIKGDLAIVVYIVHF